MAELARMNSRVFHSAAVDLKLTSNEKLFLQPGSEHVQETMQVVILALKYISNNYLHEAETFERIEE